MLNYDFHNCCERPHWKEPYAVSRVAVDRYREAECRYGCTAEGMEWGPGPSLDGWAALCVHRACERRSLKPIAEPKGK